MKNIFAKTEARLTRFFKLTRKANRRDDGVVMVEFALILPILLILFIGLVEFTQAFSVYRRLAATTGAISDLVSQEVTVDNAFLADAVTLADELMKPHGTAPMQLAVVSVIADENNVTTVDWTYPAGVYAQGAAYTLPDAALTAANTSMIVTEASYNFTPTVSKFLGAFEINETAFFRPRRALQIIKTD